VRFRHIPREKIQVIANGIDIGKYRKLDPEAIRAKKTALHLPVDAPIIGTVTRLREEKGNEFLIRAAPDVLKRFPQARFLIVGSGPLQQKLETLAAQLGVASQVLFLGFRKDTAELLSLFDVNVMASLTEGFPLVMVESMCIGNAIVATFVGGMKEIGKDQETVLFVPPKEPEAIAEKICLLLECPEWARELSRKAQASSRNFSLEASADAMGRFYRAMLSLRHPLLPDLRNDQSHEEHPEYLFCYGGFLSRHARHRHAAPASGRPSLAPWVKGHGVNPPGKERAS